MQHTNDLSSANKRVNAIKSIILLSFICFFALILTQSIPKNVEINNTSSSLSGSFEDSLTTKRRLTSTYDALQTDNVYVKIGGKPIGISVNAGGLIVIGFSEVLTEQGSVSPASETGIKLGDILLTVNGESVTSIFQLKMITEAFLGDVLNLSVMRGGEVFNVKIKPAVDKLTVQNKLGLMLKEDVGGVGTLTFVTQDGHFGALGHYIADAESGLSYELSYGNIYNTSIEGVVKGERGKAGGLIADVNRLSTPIGKIARNTDIGLFGEYVADYDGELYKIATKGEAKPGAAKIYTTIEGSEPKFYDVDIVKVVSQSEAAEKGMVIVVKDKELLEKTGGIVQGMSGSPIVQNGILIGAVTHVFVQDPTRGYAVHSRFMYDYAINSNVATLYENAA